MACFATARSATPSIHFPAGTVIGRKYRIDAFIAEGGMGIVYRGRHLTLEQQIAIKVMRPECARDPQAVDRFMDEARATARLRGIHAVRVLDTGYVGGESPYMVLEYLHGSDLSAVLDAEGPLPLGKVVDWLLQVCEGLAEAHALGIVHRDLKPGNLFLSRLPDGTEVVKVIDFGISRRIHADGCDALQSQTLGSPNYMAPEQVISPEQVDARADIWSLGVLLYELLTGTVPFKAESVAGICCKVLLEEPPSLLSLRGDLPAELEQVVLRCLRKRPDQRFGSVQELAEALVPFAAEPCVESVRRVRRIFGGLDANRDGPKFSHVQWVPEPDAELEASGRPLPPSSHGTTQISPGSAAPTRVARIAS